MFETLIIQPIFNLLLFIYAIVPGNDFGVAVIIFTLLVRFAMWPLLKKQLHQTRVMREMQPEIKAIKKKAKGDKQIEAQMMMELYREKGVNPFSAIGMLLIQLPVFIGLFSALRSLESPARIIHMPYSFIRDLQPVQNIINSVVDKTNGAIETLRTTSQTTADSLGQFGINADQAVNAEQLQNLRTDQLEVLFNDSIVSNVDGITQTLVHGPFFDQHLFGVINLARRAIEADMPIYLPLLGIAILAGVMQYLQTKQITARREAQSDGPAEKKSIRQILSESAEGKEPDQAEINAAVGSKMTVIFAPLIAYISAISLGGLAVYFASSGLIGYLQQRFVLNKDLEEMEEMADEPGPKVVKPKKKAQSRNDQKNKKNRSKSSAAKRNKKKR